MHYSIEWPRDTAAASILKAALASLSSDRGMQADRERLSRACCEPRRFVTLQGAPLPTKQGVGNRV
jgi:ArsR family transcriptional regulator